MGVRSNLEDARADRTRLHASKFTVGILADAANTLVHGMPTQLTCTPTATRIITMPDDDDPTQYGTFFIIHNAAAATHDLTIKDEAAATLGTISPLETGIIFLDALGVWRVKIGAST